MKASVLFILILTPFIARTACGTEPTFEFRADEAHAVDVARAIGEYFKVSVFVEPKVADRKVTGYLREGTLDTALDTLAFFTNSTWRRGGGAVYIGDEEKERYFSVPSAGLDAAAVKVIWPQSVLAGDTILVKAKPTEFSQLRNVVEGMQRRHSFTARILICDVSGSYRDPVNTFLGTLKLGVSTSADLLNSPKFTVPLTITDVYDFLKSQTDVRIRTFTDKFIVSGEETSLIVGNVLERQVFIRPTEAIDGGSNTLVTRFDRLQLGLTVKLRAFFYADRWFVRYDLQDADFQDDRQRNTADMGAIELTDHSARKLTSLNRNRATNTATQVKGLARVPVIGRAFRGRGQDGEERVLFVFVQWLTDQEAARLPEGVTEPPVVGG